MCEKLVGADRSPEDLMISALPEDQQTLGSAAGAWQWPARGSKPCAPYCITGPIVLEGFYRRPLHTEEKERRLLQWRVTARTTICTSTLCSTRQGGIETRH
ncbi:hypothetical protein V8C42DRAFT_325791 [Trichoderma barbatum]